MELFKFNQNLSHLEFQEKVLLFQVFCISICNSAISKPQKTNNNHWRNEGAGRNHIADTEYMIYYTLIFIHSIIIILSIEMYCKHRKKKLFQIVMLGQLQMLMCIMTLLAVKKRIFIDFYFR